MGEEIPVANEPGKWLLQLPRSAARPKNPIAVTAPKTSRPNKSTLPPSPPPSACRRPRAALCTPGQGEDTILGCQFPTLRGSADFPGPASEICHPFLWPAGMISPGRFISERDPNLPRFLAKRAEQLEASWDLQPYGISSPLPITASSGGARRAGNTEIY